LDDDRDQYREHRLVWLAADWGPKGNTGLQRLKGDKGDTGDTGLTGPSGIVRTDGSSSSGYIAGNITPAWTFLESVSMTISSNEGVWFTGTTEAYSSDGNDAHADISLCWSGGGVPVHTDVHAVTVETGQAFHIPVSMTWSEGHMLPANTYQFGLCQSSATANIRLAQNNVTVFAYNVS
jgi:hypothetical protein